MSSIFRYGFLFFILVLNGCNDHTTQGISNTFKYNIAVGLSNLDPVFAKDLAATWVCGHLYEGLFCLDSQAEVKPLLVDSFWTEDSNKRFHFYLKKNVVFHKNRCFQTPDSTRALNAHDIAYSFKRLIDPKTASPGSWTLRDKLDSLCPFQILDSSHIVIRLRQSNAQFLKILTMPYCAIVPREAVEFYGKDFRKNPVGTGAFSFKLWEISEVLFLEKNFHYHIKDRLGMPLPYLDYVKITFDENKKTELFSFEKKKLSFITGLDQSITQQVFDQEGNLKPEWRKRAKLYKKPFLNTEYIAFYMKPQTMMPAHKQMRQAINYSINREEIVKYLKYNLVTPANKGFVAPGMPNYDTSLRGYTYQPQRAKALLQSIGYNETNKPSITLSINNNMVELAELVAHQLGQIGFSVHIQLHSADMMMQLAAEGKLDFFRRSWMADYPDAENFLACFYSKNGSPPNYTRFSNQEYDKLYKKLSIETNLKQRKIYTKKMEEILIEEAPFVPIFYDQSIRLVQTNIEGMEQNAVNSLDLRRVRIRQNKK